MKLVIFYILANYIQVVFSMKCDLFSVESLEKSIECENKSPGVSVLLKRYNYTLKTGHSNLTYHIPYVSYSDAGVYICEYNSTDKYKYYINFCVYENPFLKSNGYEIKYADSSQESVNLTCDTPIMFPASYEWRIDNNNELIGKDKSISIQTSLISERFLFFKCLAFYQSKYVGSKLFSVIFQREPTNPTIRVMKFSNNFLDIVWDPPIYNGGLSITSILLKCNWLSKEHVWSLSPKLKQFSFDLLPFDSIFRCSVSYMNSKFQSQADVFDISSETSVGDFSIEQVILNEKNILQIEWFQPKNIDIAQRCFININKVKTNQHYQMLINSQQINQQMTPKLDPKTLYKITVHYLQDEKLLAYSRPVFINTHPEEYHPILYPSMVSLGSTYIVLSWASKSYDHEQIYQIRSFICEFSANINNNELCDQRAFNLRISAHSINRVLNLTNLKPNTSYIIRISQKPYAFDKYSEWCAPISFRTKSPELSRPFEVTMKRKDNVVYISWTHTQHAYTQLTGFMITLFFHDKKINLFVPYANQSLNISLLEKPIKSVSVAGFMRQTRGEEAILHLNNVANKTRFTFVYISLFGVLLLVVFIILYIKTSNQRKNIIPILIEEETTTPHPNVIRNVKEKKNCFCLRKQCIFCTLEPSSSPMPSEKFCVFMKIVPGLVKAISFKMEFKHINDLINTYKLEHQINMIDDTKTVFIRIESNCFNEIVLNESKNKNSQILSNLLEIFSPSPPVLPSSDIIPRNNYKESICFKETLQNCQSFRLSRSYNDINFSESLNFENIEKIISTMIMGMDRCNEKLKLFLQKNFASGLKLLLEKIDFFVEYLNRFENGFVTCIQSLPDTEISANTKSDYIVGMEENEIEKSKINEKVNDMFDCLKNMNEEINKVFETRNTNFETAMDVTEKSINELKEIMEHVNNLSRIRLEKLHSYVSKCNDLHQETNKLLNIKSDVKCLRDNVDNIAKIVNNIVSNS